jgi:alpha-L-rhamnosidase
MNRRDFLRGSLGATALPLPSVGRTFPPSRGALRRDLDEARRAKSGRSADSGDGVALAQSRADDFVSQAERLKPSLARTVHAPTSVVEPVADAGAFLRWRMNRTASAESIESRLFKPGDTVILDFGTHLTGHFALSLGGEGRGIDAPARLKLTFGEVPGEVAEPFDPYRGWLSRAWLQDEIINVDVLPATIQLPRRYAFRYVKIEVIATSPNYALRIAGVNTTALSSGSGAYSPLAAATPERLRQIDEVSVRTLRECMQTVFEDGPKRDRRLWIGDLRLQALTNYVTVRNFDLVKRCLLLFAGLPREDGLVSACVFEDPQPLRGHEYIMDYAALYAATVVDYAEAANDWDTAVTLWPVVKRQMELLTKYVSADGVFADPGGWWIFIDWSEPLERTASMHGVLLYSLRYALKLARKVGAPESAEYARLIELMKAGGHRAFYDRAQQLFVSGSKRQVSWATQAWMALSGVASREEGARALTAVKRIEAAVRPGAPYLYHYVADAMIQCGLQADALDLIDWYWGGMVQAGADTFWEVYDPKNPSLSPYGNVLTNSYCHAWSCTPAFLLRKGGLAALTPR